MKRRTTTSPAKLDAATRRRVDAVRNAFAANTDPDRAPGMQAYMKSSMPYYGVAATPMRRLSQALFRTWWPLDAEQWRDTIAALWDTAQFREQRYAAIALLAWRPAKEHRTRDVLPLIERLVVEGAWWDYIDAMAHVVGEILRKDARTVATLRRWSKGENLWLRRIAILSQLDFKHDTDVALLYELIEPSLDSQEFFLRKAIGWALRQLARVHPKAVVDYVATLGPRLSALSRREALKHQ
jgi:3-methyladenine DNA glycosylase AlkD